MIRRTVLRGKNGFTLVEVMVALLLLLLVSLALMQTALVSVSAGMTNVLRDEAVSIAEMRMDEARSLAFTQTTDNLVSDSSDSSLTSTICPADFISKFSTTGQRISRSVRNISSFDFCTNRTVAVIDGDNKSVTITIGWKWKGEDYTHTFQTIVKKQ